MGPTEDRRAAIRVPLEGRLRYNLLSEPDAFERRLLPAAALFGKTFSGKGLDAKDPRDAFLLRLDEKLDYLIEMTGEREHGKSYEHSGRLIDIGEAGLRFVSQAPLEPGQLVELGLKLPGRVHRTMEIAASVLWCVPGSDGGLETGLDFADVLSEDQEEIVRYVFSKQRELLRARRREE